jgi:hypothetical protein
MVRPAGAGQDNLPTAEKHRVRQRQTRRSTATTLPMIVASSPRIGV